MKLSHRVHPNATVDSMALLCRERVVYLVLFTCSRWISFLPYLVGYGTIAMAYAMQTVGPAGRASSEALLDYDIAVHFTLPFLYLLLVQAHAMLSVKLATVGTNQLPSV